MIGVKSAAANSHITFVKHLRYSSLTHPDGCYLKLNKDIIAWLCPTVNCKPDQKLQPQRKDKRIQVICKGKHVQVETGIKMFRFQIAGHENFWDWIWYQVWPGILEGKANRISWNPSMRKKLLAEIFSDTWDSWLSLVNVNEPYLLLLNFKALCTIQMHKSPCLFRTILLHLFTALRHEKESWTH